MSIFFSFSLAVDDSDVQDTWRFKLKREMGGSVGVGFIAVFAVSGSVVLLVHQAHKRLLSDFMKKVESELGSTVVHSYGKKKTVESEMGSIFYANAKNKFNGTGM